MERAEKAKSPEMETAGLPPNDMKRFYANGRRLLREIAGLYVLIPAGAAAPRLPGRPPRDRAGRRPARLREASAAEKTEGKAV